MDRGNNPTYRVLAHDIKNLGINCVFGLMSDDTAMFATELDVIGVSFHGARHENNAIAMAEGYSAASGQLGIAVIGRGPAAANGLHAAISASRTGSKVLIIYGEAPVPGDAINNIGPDYKAFNSRGVMEAAGLHSFFPTSAHGARAALADAVAIAARGHAVTLHLPTNVQLSEMMVNRNDPAPALPEAIPPSPARDQTIAAVVDVLAASRRPVILAGMGAYLSGAGPALEELSDRIGALLATSARGKDLFRNNAYNLGIIGSFSHSVGRRYMQQADCVLVFGAALNFLTMSFGESLPPVPLIHVDRARPHIGRYTEADLAVVGDARLVAEQLIEALPNRILDDKPFRAEAIRTELTSFDISSDFQPAHTARTVDPRSLALKLDQLLPDNRNLVYDAGNFLGVVPYLRTPGPGHFKLTNEFASIGLGFGTALGFSMALPEATTVLVIGDGGFVMTMSELETAAREDIKVIVVVMNDCAYGAELHLLRTHQQPVEKSLFPDIDFAPVAAAFGFEAVTIRSLQDLVAVEHLLRDPQGPVFLDCKINADIAAPFMGEFAAYEQRNK
ncbi:MAG: hypothetical protein CMM58_12610 [Rhodospirillaceae bacterium]|nr:hypothetical protein [Rhodospirillaceae bacterium]